MKSPMTIMMKMMMMVEPNALMMMMMIRMMPINMMMLMVMKSTHVASRNTIGFRVSMSHLRSRPPQGLNHDHDHDDCGGDYHINDCVSMLNMVMVGTDCWYCIFICVYVPPIICFAVNYSHVSRTLVIVTITTNDNEVWF